MTRKRRVVKEETTSVAVVPNKDTSLVGHLEYLTVRSVTKEAFPNYQTKQIDETILSVTDRAIEPPIPPERLLTLYEENAVHAACIDAKAADAVGQGWRLIPEGETTVTTEPQSEQEVDLKQRLEAVTPDLTFSELLLQAAREQQIFGMSAWEIIREAVAVKAPEPEVGDKTVEPQGVTEGGVFKQDPSPLADIVAIYPIPGHTIRATRSRDLYVQTRSGRLRWFKRFGCEAEYLVSDGSVAPPGTPPEMLASEILIFRTYNARSPYYGIPDWVSAIPALAELTAIREFNISWFSSGGTADRIVSITAASNDTAKEAASNIEAKLRANAGRGHVTIVVSGTEDLKVDVKSMASGTGRGEGNRERQFRGGREDLVKEVLMSHRTPPYRVGWADLGGLGGNAAKEMLRAYRLGGIEPIQTIMEDRLNQTLFGPQGFDLKGLRWELTNLDWDVMELNMDKATKGVTAGILTPSQGAVLLGLPPADPSDECMHEHYIGQNMIPLERLYEGSEQEGVPNGAVVPGRGAASAEGGTSPPPAKRETEPEEGTGEAQTEERAPRH